MRICFVLASTGNGGLEKHVRELSHELSKLGHYVSVIAPKVFLATLAPQIEKKPINVNRSRFNPLLLLSVLMQLRAVKPDIIHAQANKAATLVGTLRFFLTCPTVATLHNIKTNIEPYLKFNHIICVSNQLAHLFKHQTNDFKNHSISVIYNGIEPPVLHALDLKSQFSLPKNYPVICAVGRLVEAKGFDVLLDAIDGLPVSLIIVGDGPERKKLEAKIKILDPITSCKCLGYQANSLNLMHSSDAVIISSRREGFSYVLNEALLARAKVLATDVPVANEVLPLQLIVPTQNPQALREKLVYLLSNTNEWNTLMKPAQSFANQHMTLANMAQNTVTLYEQLLNTQSPIK